MKHNPNVDYCSVYAYTLKFARKYGIKVNMALNIKFRLSSVICRSSSYLAYQWINCTDSESALFGLLTVVICCR